MKANFFKCLSISLLFYSPAVWAQSYLIKSPRGHAEVEITIGDEIRYAVRYHGVDVISHSKFGLQFAQSRFLGHDLYVTDTAQRVSQEKWTTVIGKHKEVENYYNELVIALKERRFPARTLSLAIRAYDEGVAFRYYIPESWKRFLPNYEQNTRLTLLDEIMEFNFTSNHRSWAADYRSYATHQEEEFNPVFLDELRPEQVIGLPFVVQIRDDCFAAVTEADLTDWAGMYLKKDRSDVERPYLFTTDLSPLPGNPAESVKILPGSWSPWRVIMLGASAGELIESEMINNLNDPCAIADPSWITPGISAWDHWWSGEVKMDTETIKDYIELAAEMGWEYMLIDWHWYGAPFITEGVWRADPEADITTVNPAVNMDEIRAFAKQKGVKLVLWLLWDHVEKQMDEAFALYESWGISGVKIDFMARDDQEMVNWYHKVVKKAAEHKLVVDFHGAYKPTGWSRTYPNLITREGVLGNEYSKWSSRITPEHNVTIPFTRMIAGAMDYTPGGFLNVTAESFRTGAPAQVMTTRAHQLAMFVIYFSPYTVACDHPDHYLGQKGIEFLKEVPTIWDDTKFLSGDIGDHIIMARKRGDRWFIGGMNNSEPKQIALLLDFLPTGKYKLHYFKDTAESNQDPTVLEIGTENVDKNTCLQIKMEKGGGFAAYIDLK